MTWLCEFHGGPDRDAVIEYNESQPATKGFERILDRRWDPLTQRFVETKLSYIYVARNDGGESAVTHYFYGGYTESLAPLTPRQRECLEFIKGFIQLNHQVPTIGDISRALGHLSPAPTLQLVHKLRQKGYLSAKGTTLEVLG